MFVLLDMFATFGSDTLNWMQVLKAVRTNRLKKKREKVLGHQIKEKDFGELLRTLLGTVTEPVQCLYAFASTILHMEIIMALEVPLYFPDVRCIIVTKKNRSGGGTMMILIQKL